MSVSAHGGKGNESTKKEKETSISDKVPATKLDTSP